MSEQKRVLAWHFVRPEMVLANGDNRPVRVGELLSVDGDIKLCDNGLHASIRLCDAIVYRPRCDSALCRVELSGDMDTDMLKD